MGILRFEQTLVAHCLIEQGEKNFFCVIIVLNKISLEIMKEERKKNQFCVM